MGPLTQVATNLECPRFVLAWIASVQRFGGSRLFFTALVAALLMTLTDRADACSCSPMGPPPVAYSKAGAVFEGRLVDKSSSLRSWGPLNWLPSRGWLGFYTSVSWYHFEASRVWKGPRQKRFQLFCSDSCDVEFSFGFHQHQVQASSKALGTHAITYGARAGSRRQSSNAHR